MNITKEDIYKRIEVLNFTLWENRAFKTHIEAWLRNFKNETDQSYALYMLSRMMYFSADNIRNLLRTLYRDKIRYPLIRDIRKRNGNTLDPEVLEPEFFEELKNTRFLGVGNPSESGVHLLYYFRQENNIPKDLFVNTDDLVIYEQNEDGEVHAKLRDKFKNVKRFVFIDDLCTAPQKLDTFGVFFMKYNYEIRLKAVKLVLEGGLSVREAGCHLGCGRSQVHLWVTLFERHGLTGLKLRHGSYSAEFKLSVLKHMHQNHLSLLETAVHFGIPGPFVIRQWERLYQNQGAEGLRRKPQRRRPAMSKSKTKKVKLKTTPHEELLKELEYLRAENAYLKKLQALVEERIVRESGKEPKPSKD